VPGLVSDELKEADKRNNGIPDAYDNKFGGSADALASGKVLFGNHNTWETHWMTKKFNFNWDIYPVPHAENVAERIQTHVDYVFMTSAVTEEKAAAAYEVVKFLSYSEEGCLARMKYVSENPETEALYTPASSDPEVLAAYGDSEIVPEGMKYMLNTISEDPEKIFIADANKLVPNFWSDVDEYLKQTEEQIKNGSDAYALAQDLQNKVNAAATETWKTFETKLTNHLEKFYESHPYENK
jgi:ABC-type glycerol-3-phosphate transport system substrate-binding protein